MFEIGDRVRLAEPFRCDFDPLGTVIGFSEIDIGLTDVVVRWDDGIETALAPASLAGLKCSEAAG